MFRKKASLSMLLLLVAAGLAQAATESADLLALRAETRQLEREMYELFNTLNDDDELDVSCDERKVTGSVIPVWSCEAAFMRKASTGAMASRFDNPGAGMANTQNGFIPQSREQTALRSRKKVQQLNDQMRDLARRHPELAAAMIAFNNKREQLAQLEE